MKWGLKVIFLLVVNLLLPLPICYADSLEQSITRLTNQISSTINQKDKQKVAVAEFCDLNGRVTKFGKFISEEILLALVRDENIVIVERQHLQKVMEEKKFKGSGIADAKSAQKIGIFLGADIMCIGVITIMPKTVRINARIVDTRTGSISGVASVNVDRNADIDYLIGDDFAVPQPEIKKQKPLYRKGNMVINGDFSRSLEGWHRQIGDITKGHSQAEVISFAHGKSGKALHISHRGEGNIQFSQLVSVAGPDLIFSASFQMNSHEGSIIGFSGSGVAQAGLIYMDEEGNKLGETILVNYVKNPFADTPLIGVPRRDDDTYRKHFIEIPNGKYLQGYRVDVRKEIESNLMGIQPENIKKVAVVLWCGATHNQAGSELWITDICLKKR